MKMGVPSLHSTMPCHFAQSIVRLAFSLHALSASAAIRPSVIARTTASVASISASRIRSWSWRSVVSSVGCSPSGRRGHLVQGLDHVSRASERDLLELFPVEKLDVTTAAVRGSHSCTGAGPVSVLYRRNDVASRSEFST